jgi:hypothetical protein
MRSLLFAPFYSPRGLEEQFREMDSPENTGKQDCVIHDSAGHGVANERRYADMIE